MSNTNNHSFTLDNNHMLIPAAEFPEGWREDQTFLKALYAEKAGQKEAKGFNLDGEAVNVVFARGKYGVRAARGFGSCPNSNKAEKRANGSSINDMIEHPDTLLGQLEAEQERLQSRLSQVDKLLTALRG